MAVQTTPFKASGTTLSYKVSPASVYTALAQLVNFDEGGRAIAPIDTTTLTATVKTSIPSILDNGELTFTVYDVPGESTGAQLVTLTATPEVCAWQIQYPDGSSPTTGTTDAFSAFLTNYAPKGFAVDGTPTVDVTIKITGAITRTAGS
jgi:Lambda phage tail tube protein, TTP